MPWPGAMPGRRSRSPELKTIFPHLPSSWSRPAPTTTAWGTGRRRRRDSGRDWASPSASGTSAAGGNWQPGGRWACISRGSSTAWPPGRLRCTGWPAPPLTRVAQPPAHAILGKIWYLMPRGRTDIAIKELQEATRLLAGRGSRADEIVIYGVLALAYLRRQDEEQAQLAAHRAANLIA